MTKRTKISLLAWMGILLAGCSLKLTESHLGQYSSYEKYESKYKVKNKEGLEFGEERIPRIKKQIYQVRLNDSTILDLKWFIKRPIVGNHFISRIDSSLRIEHLSRLDPINDSLIATYRSTHFTTNPVKNNRSQRDSSNNRTIDFLRYSPDFDKPDRSSKRKIQILKNGRCIYNDYVPGGPDSGGGRYLTFSGTILIEGDTVTAILYRDKLPIKPFEIKWVKNGSNDTLKSVTDDKISNKYGYIKIVK